MGRVREWSNTLRPHAHNVVWSNANTLVTSAFGLMTSALLVRLAGKEVYGEYLFVLGTFGLLSCLAIPGVRTVLFRTTAQGSDGVYSRATKFSFVWSLTGVPVLVVIGLVVYFFKARSSGIGLMLSAPFFPLVVSLQTWMPFLKAKSRFRTLFFLNFVRFLAKLVILVFALLVTRNVIVLILVHFVTFAGTNIAYYLGTLAARRNDIVEEGWRRQSYALTIMDLSSLAFGQVDIVLLGFLLPFESLAVYGIVMRVGGLVFQAIRSSMEAILPSLFRSTRIQLRDFYKPFALSFLLPIVLYPAIRFPLVLIYGSDSRELVLYCQVYLLILPIYFLNSVTASFMIKYQLNKEINISRIIAIVAVILLYSFLIPMYGIWGGVVSSMLFYMILLAMNFILMKTAEARGLAMSAGGVVAGRP